jgi:predicted ribosomally synthesized peptide with nif11-like leader
MSTEQKQALLAAAAEDLAIRQRFLAVGSAQEAAAIARELGFDVTAEDFLEQQADGELSDAELGVVAGGTVLNFPTMQCSNGSFQCH